MDSPPAPNTRIEALERETGFGWGWFIVVGVALLVAGVLAILSLPVTSAASLYAVGMLMLIGAVAQLATRLLAPAWRGTGFLVFRSGARAGAMDAGALAAGIRSRVQAALTAAHARTPGERQTGVPCKSHKRTSDAGRSSRIA